MRLPLAILCLLLGNAASATAGPVELVTAPDAILCLDAENLTIAAHPAVAKSQIVLRAMGCMRSQAGIRSRVVRNAPDGAWQVRFYPQGISGGVTLWGRPSSFTAPGGSRPDPVERS